MSLNHMGDGPLVETPLAQSEEWMSHRCEFLITRTPIFAAFALFSVPPASGL